MKVPAASTGSPPEAVPNSYIVVLKREVNDAAYDAHHEWLSGIYGSRQSRVSLEPETSTEHFTHRFNFADFKAYSGTYDPATIDQIASRSDVAYVEPDAMMYALDIDEASTGDEQTAPREIVIQDPIPSWGLGAVSHRSGDGYLDQFVSDGSAGSGIQVYVLDTGIRITHHDFGGRAIWGANFVPDSRDTDMNGHGTHISGTIAGETYGVAKRANVVAVKVLGDRGGGTASGVIAGIQWVVKNAPRGRAVANMSLGGGFSQALNEAVDNAVAAGVTLVVAAGSENQDASAVSPASAAGAITVASTMRDRARSGTSNFGRSVDIFAPGLRIVSCGIKNDDDQVEMSGTSTATPHVAGISAYLIRSHNLTGSAAVRNKLLEVATPNIISDVGPGSPNSFLYNGSGF